MQGVSRNHKRRSNKLSKKFGALAAVCACPILFMFSSQGQKGRGMIAAVIAIVIIIAVRLFWELKRNVLFWIAIALIVAIHLPIISFIPWPNSHARGSGLSVIGLPDFFLVYGIFKVVHKLVSRNADASSTS